MAPTIIIADTETSSLDDPKIVQVAWAEVNDRLQIVSQYSTFVDPEVPMSAGASGVNGIRDNDLVGAPLITDVKFPKGEVYLICHNVAFDKPLLDPYMLITGEMCTLMLARRLYPDAPNHKLSTLSAHLDLPRRDNHDAMEDVFDCLSLLRKMMADFESDIYDMDAYFNEDFIFKVMPFGKHVGVSMEDVPKRYLGWLNKQSNLDRDLKSTLRYYLK